LESDPDPIKQFLAPNSVNKVLQYNMIARLEDAMEIERWRTSSPLLEAPRMDPQSWPVEPQDYKQECTEHEFTGGVNSKSAWRAARLQSSCTGVHSRTRHRSAMALTVYDTNHRSDGN
jgi:hypothetical protein